MEDVDNANNDVAEKEESTDSVPSPLFSGTVPQKRLRSKVWDDFIPTIVDGKLAGAQCMHCCRTFNCTGTTGTSNLQNHLAKCKPEIMKRPRQQVSKMADSDPKQKKLPFLLSRQTKCASTADAMHVQELVLPDIVTEKNRKNQEVDKNVYHEEIAEPGFPIDLQKNRSHEQTALSEQDFPSGRSQKNQVVDQNCSPEELVRLLAIHGHLPRMMEQDGFRKVLACLDPMVTMSSSYDFIGTTMALFQQEKSNLKEPLAALDSRICLSAYLWNHDPHLAFLCLSAHYIDDEWEKQQKIITFSPVDSSCNAKELCNIILGAIGEWGLDGKVFSIILDDAFIDDSVASDVKAGLQKRNKLSASQSMFVVRYASHLLDRVIQVGLDELDKIMEKSSKCFKYTEGRNRSKVQYPNCRNAPSPKDWRIANHICEILEDFHVYIDVMPKFPRPDYLFDTLKKVFRKADFYSGLYNSDEAFSNVLEKIKQKFHECWKSCFLHFCMPMVMDPEYSLKCIKPHARDKDEDDYIRKVRDTFLILFNEYSGQVDDSNCALGSKTSKETVLDEDTLLKYYQDSKKQSCERPMTELCQYLQERRPATTKTSVLRWWKEHSLTYPTIARMARDILALPCNDDCSLAKITAGLAMCASASERHVEMLVCTQDWLTPAGAKCVEQSDDI